MINANSYKKYYKYKNKYLSLKNKLHKGGGIIGNCTIQDPYMLADIDFIRSKLDITLVSL